MPGTLYSCRPDAWAIIKITEPREESIYKVLAGWHGGFPNGPAWRINSGIVRADNAGDHFVVHGYSGSTYLCWNDAYGTSSLAHSVFLSLVAQLGASNVKLEMLDKEVALLWLQQASQIERTLQN